VTPFFAVPAVLIIQAIDHKLRMKQLELQMLAKARRRLLGQQPEASSLEKVRSSGLVDDFDMLYACSW
jgi:hypothetical protein